MMEDKIYADIVKIARIGATTSKIIQASASLTSNQVNKHLHDMERIGLIVYDLKTDTYIATKEGMNFLESYEETSDVLQPLKDFT
jgi:predicted transcriptional regulator